MVSTLFHSTAETRQPLSGQSLRWSAGWRRQPGEFRHGDLLAHNLPLMSNPHIDPLAAERFNESVRRLWVPFAELKDSISGFQRNQLSGRPRERDNPLTKREVKLNQIPPPVLRPVPENRHNPSAWTRTSPMFAVDAMFLAAVQGNPHRRPRIGNPDEMRSNRMIRTLENLKFRVTDPEH